MADVIELVVLNLQIHQLLLVILEIWAVLQLLESLASFPEQINILNNVLGNHLRMPLRVLSNLLSSADHGLLDERLLLLDCKCHRECNPRRGYRAQICNSEISDLSALPISACVRIVRFLMLLRAENFIVRITPARLRGQQAEVQMIDPRAEAWRVSIRLINLSDCCLAEIFLHQCKLIHLTSTANYERSGTEA